MSLMSNGFRYTRVGLAAALCALFAGVIVLSSSTAAGAQSEEESETFYECPDAGWHIVGDTCVRAEPDVTVDLPYIPGTDPVAAVPAVDPQCPSGYTGDGIPPTVCSVNVSTADEVNAQITAGADCSTAISHANGLAKGFCSVDAIGGSPAVPAIAATAATCDGIPTTMPASQCVEVLPGGNSVIAATPAATVSRTECLDGGTRTGDTCIIALPDTTEPLPYTPAVPAQPAVADVCPANTQGDNTPPTKCFVSVTSPATITAQEALGADCSGTTTHSNGTAKGFCTRPVIVGSPAVAAQSATCDGAPTTAPQSSCTQVVSNELAYPATPFVYSCADGTTVTVTQGNYNCVGQLPSTVVPLIYTAAVPAVPAVPGIPATCQDGTQPDGDPVQKCFVNVDSVVARNALIADGFNCVSSIPHANGTAKGFCQVPPIAGTPGTPATAAVAATCAGVPTFEPESACVQEVPGGDIQVPAEFLSRGITHTVSCLAGNGRVDTNIINAGAETATYRVEFEGLTARARAVPATEWWRVPVTGRADRSYDIVVKRDGAIVSQQSVTVACDVETPTVGRYEVRVVNACLGGNGYVLFQFANDTDVSRSWVVEFGTLNNRSTTAAPYGASVRAVSGRPDGDHDYLIRVGSQIVQTGTVTVTCD